MNSSANNSRLAIGRDSEGQEGRAKEEIPLTSRDIKLKFY